MYRIQPPKHYKKKFDGSKSLFQICWEDFLRDSPNVENDEEVYDYLDYRASEYVNDSHSRFYLYG
jgi:hypothetical protein